ncbi:hypothetical protein ID866_11847 [Astraeus odoratus]|nr:hypothetical protein ID866_11847 [Astraeus odoratus]
MSAFCCTPSPNNAATAKVKDPQQYMEEDWMLISEAKLDPMLSNDEEEAEKKEKEEREAAAWKAQEAAEVQADAEWRALKERLWDAAAQHSEMVAAPPQIAKPGGRMSVVGPSIPGQRASGVQDPCTQCCNKGTLCVLSVVKGKTMACKACYHMKVSCSWMKRPAGEAQKKKWVHHLEEADDVEMVEVGEDDEEEDAWALTATLDMLSMEFYEFWMDYWGFGGEVLRVMDIIAQELKRANNLKEEEMGKAKGKSKEKEEGPRMGRTEDKDGDMEMGRAGPSSLA